jgi:hypothetical protein
MLAHNRTGGYRFLAAEGRPFSGGAVADEGFDLAHATFERPIPLEAGLAAAARHVIDSGRPVSAIAGFELRIPAPLTDADFESFNRGYVSKLKGLGLEVDGLMPAARTNVAPTVGAVSEPSVYAVSYTVPARSARRAFVLSGVPEAEPADTATMVDSMIGALTARLTEVGASWNDATAIQLYGVDDFTALVAETMLSRIGPRALPTIHWFPSRPPIEGLNLEVDVRAAGVELVRLSAP